MTAEFVLGHTVPAACSLLPQKMDTPEARALVLAIGLQESGFQYRLQMGGPARGYWQFEEGGGVRGVLTHANSQGWALGVCDRLGYPNSVLPCYYALADNDVLACAFARLLLWTLPGALATRSQPGYAWDQYLTAWRPGKPRLATWDGHFATAWDLVES